MLIGEIINKSLKCNRSGEDKRKESWELWEEESYFREVGKESILIR